MKKLTTTERLDRLEKIAALVLKHIQDAGDRQAAYAKRMIAVQFDEDECKRWNQEAQRNAQKATGFLEEL